MGEKRTPDSSAVPQVPHAALVRSDSSHLASEMRDVAREAARQWGQKQLEESQAGDPAKFGQAVATVYLAALAGISAGFEPDAECPAGRA